MIMIREGAIMNMQEFLKNRNQFPPDELEKYAGEYIAWSPDGKKIIAGDKDPLKVVALVRSSGFDPAECVLSSVPLADELVLGGGIDE
jgi:hypothetical protein